MASPIISDQNLNSTLREDREFPPPAEFAVKAHVRSLAEYEELYARSIADPEAFWESAARELHWFAPWTKVLDWDLPWAKWFVGGKINISYNCLDRHVHNGKGDKTAILWEGEPGEVRKVSYGELLADVQKFGNALKSLGIRAGILVLILGAVFTVSGLWHRAVLRYVQDSRRRYQLLLLRRIALWSLVVAIIGFTFASELSSIVTFAGLITAGVAVAMQSVLVSIVGYFFLIGKYGIRVGDRVQIGEVSGEIIELGLVRMYLMELAGHGSFGPTGRVAAFPNSVVFQVSTGLFKQIPGVNFGWHEITLSLPSGVDYASTKEKLFAAANDALADYREEIERQTRELERTTMSSAGGKVAPTVQLSYSAKGVDARVRYPVHLPHAAEIDERMSRALLQVVSGLAAAAPATTPAPTSKPD